MNKMLSKQRRGGGGKHMFHFNFRRNMFHRNLWSNASRGN
jgi:hypothetical protein